MGSRLRRRYPHLFSLGMVVEVVDEKLVTHQRPHLENKLKKRGLLAPNFGNGEPTRATRRPLPPRRQ
eukprot:7010765-Prorocentrum_lima.AAC.1